ncbi:MAG: hypothetical protein RIC55_26620 [Pirellulaceae bacterium]
MNRSRVCTVLALLLAAALIAGGPLTGDPPESPAGQAEDNAKQQQDAAPRAPAKLPPGAEIRLVPLKQRWLLGENILLYYEVKNTGDAPFEVDIGGDYRGGARANRFKVIALSEKGAPQEDPAPEQIDMGGLGGSFEVLPGQSWIGNVPLMRYRTLAQPGVYALRVAHDLGWGGPVVDGMLDPRWADAEIRVDMPGDMQAREVVEAIQGMTDFGASWGERRAMYPDYSTLRYPVYLPVLMELARAHHPEAVQGIAGIETPAATTALIELLSLPDDEEKRLAVVADLKQRGVTAWEQDAVSDLAARALRERVPMPEPLRATAGYSWRSDAWLEARKKRVAACWRPGHAAPVRQYAKEILLHAKSSNLRDSRKEFAAELLQSVGVAEDHAAIVKALDEALALSARVPLESPLTYGFLPDLKQCASILEIPAPAEPKTPGQIAVYLLALERSDGPTAEDFARRGPGWLRHATAYVRRLTLEALPRPAPPWAIDQLGPLLESKDVGVRLQAAETATAAGEADLAAAVMQQLAVEKDPWVMAELDRAAYASGAPRDKVLEAWARRLDETMYDAATQKWGSAAKSFEMLQTGVIEYEGGSGWDGNQTGEKAPGLAERWLAFIAANREQLRRGRKYRVGDAELKPNLFPRGAHIYHDGLPWPVRDASQR